MFRPDCFGVNCQKFLVRIRGRSGGLGGGGRARRSALSDGTRSGSVRRDDGPIYGCRLTARIRSRLIKNKKGAMRRCTLPGWCSPGGSLPADRRPDMRSLKGGSLHHPPGLMWLNLSHDLILGGGGMLACLFARSVKSNALAAFAVCTGATRVPRSGVRPR